MVHKSNDEKLEGRSYNMCMYDVYVMTHSHAADGIEEFHLTSRASYITKYVAINMRAWNNNRTGTNNVEGGDIRSRGTYL